VAAAVSAARGLALIDFDENLLRGPEMGEAASRVGAIPEVREALVESQRAFARRPSGAILDGRDIGTIICPDADVKIFVTATPETRATRRALELKGQGAKVDYTVVLEDIRKRDERDATRSLAPLRAADDAVILDTTKLDVEASFKAALAIVEKQILARKAQELSAGSA
jgi:cytidylate kinase